MHRIDGKMLHSRERMGCMNLQPVHRCRFIRRTRPEIVSVFLFYGIDWIASIFFDDVKKRARFAIGKGGMPPKPHPPRLELSRRLVNVELFGMEGRIAFHNDRFARHFFHLR
jgi:hypothetical protein